MKQALKEADHQHALAPGVQSSTIISYGFTLRVTVINGVPVIDFSAARQRTLGQRLSLYTRISYEIQTVISYSGDIDLVQEEVRRVLKASLKKDGVTSALVSLLQEYKFTVDNILGNNPSFPSFCLPDNLETEARLVACCTVLVFLTALTSLNHLSNSCSSSVIEPIRCAHFRAGRLRSFQKQVCVQRLRRV
jgi:hypothetical protein